MGLQSPVHKRQTPISQNNAGHTGGPPWVLWSLVTWSLNQRPSWRLIQQSFEEESVLSPLLGKSAMKPDPREKQVLPKPLTSQAPGSRKAMKPPSASYFLVPAPSSTLCLTLPFLPIPCKSPCFLRTRECSSLSPWRRKTCWRLPVFLAESCLHHTKINSLTTHSGLSYMGHRIDDAIPFPEKWEIHQQKRPSRGKSEKKGEVAADTKHTLLCLLNYFF